MLAIGALTVGAAGPTSAGQEPVPGSRAVQASPASAVAPGAASPGKRPPAGPPRRGDAPADLRTAAARTKPPLPWLRTSVEQVLRAERARAGLTGTDVPGSGSGRLAVVEGADDAPRPAARVMSVRVEVEEGLPVDGAAFADFAMTVLNDERGWGHDGSVTFARTDGTADLRVVLASGALTDDLCFPLRTLGEVSCGTAGRAVLNAERWSDGAEPFVTGGGTLTDYRQYLVNHEVGHLLGRPHQTCPATGEPAPVMVQQTLDLQGCLPNGWPAG